MYMYIYIHIYMYPQVCPHVYVHTFTHAQLPFKKHGDFSKKRLTFRYSSVFVCRDSFNVMSQDSFNDESSLIQIRVP